MSWEIRYWIWRSNVIEMIHLIHLHVIWNRCLKFYRRKTRSNSTVSQVFQKSNWNCNESHKSKTMPHTTILFTIFNQNVSISHLSYPTVERKKNSFKWQKLAGFCWNIRHWRRKTRSNREGNWKSGYYFTNWSEYLWCKTFFQAFFLHFARFFLWHVTYAIFCVMFDFFFHGKKPKQKNMSCTFWM